MHVCSALTSGYLNGPTTVQSLLRCILHHLNESRTFAADRESESQRSRLQLGHGYCAYDFFEQCPHRMACAKCSFYVPKDSSKAQLLEGRANLLRMMQEIPLTDEEKLAVEDGIAALNRLSKKLADIPAPDGRTPKQLVQITKERK
jgi:hypothetical protein